MRVGMAWIAVWLLPVAGCVESIPLGSECPERFAHCASKDIDIEDVRPNIKPDGSVRVPQRPMHPLDGGSSLDGALVANDADTLSEDAASPPRDGGAEPTIANGSFELTRGRPGLLAIEVLERFTTTRVDPWRVCWLGFSVLTSASPVRGGAPSIEPSDGASFIENELMFGPMRGALAQTLARPLVRGERYGFRIDVRASQGADTTLELWGTSMDCMAHAKLADVGPVPTGGWESRCLSFVAPSDYTQVMLVPVGRTGDRIADRDGARVFFDNLRDDPSCR